MNAKLDKYPGHKNIQGVYHKIINNIPHCTTYIEVFAGSGVIGNMLVKYAPDTTDIIFNDIDKSTIAKFNYTQAKIIYNYHFRDLLQLEWIVSRSIDTFIFMDPPYLLETRPNTPKLYKYEMTTKEHIELIQTVLQLDCNAMIIHPKCELYDSLLSSGWRAIEVKIRYNRKTSIENIYMNYPIPRKLLITKFVGENCWDRQRIKRKGISLVHKIKSLPDHERQYILEQISKEFNSSTYINNCSGHKQ